MVNQYIINHMRARDHALIGALSASALIPVLGVNSVVFWTASVLIDGDHYVDYVYRNGFKDFSIKGMFRFNRSLSAVLSEENKKGGFLTISLLHTIEALGFLYIASELTGWLWLQSVFWGMLFHISTDLVHKLVRGGRIFGRALSIMEYVIRSNSMKRRGIQPQEVYRRAAAQLTDSTEIQDIKESE